MSGHGPAVRVTVRVRSELQGPAQVHPRPGPDILDIDKNEHIPMGPSASEAKDACLPPSGGTRHVPVRNEDQGWSADTRWLPIGGSQNAVHLTTQETRPP
eukprot:356295-Chlamydomonas_euryale.AAC.4